MDQVPVIVCTDPSAHAAGQENKIMERNAGAGQHFSAALQEKLVGK